MSRLATILNSVFEQPQQWVAAWDKDARKLPDLIEELIGNEGEVSGGMLSRKILDTYVQLNSEEKLDFFRFLAENLDIDPAQVSDKLAAYQAKPGKTTYKAFMAAAEPKRQELIRRLNQVRSATHRLVKIRAELLEFAKQEKRIATVDLDFKHLFTSWFNKGFLVLSAINWNSSADMLEKIIQYEAVHEITSWDDLRRRLKPEDRRCFAYFHPAMPDEPLIFVEVALIKGKPDNIQTLLSEGREAIIPGQANTAVFYSISNCQAGLAGISFGNSLIKHVVAELSQELPNLKKFITLSPIPGFTSWIKSTEREKTRLSGSDFKKLASHYLLEIKNEAGWPLDPVARFHLGNGAMIKAIHANADESVKGQSQSYGLMVNYLYDPGNISSNHEGFVTRQRIAASTQVASLNKACIADNL